jgi:Caspase domain
VAAVFEVAPVRVKGSSVSENDRIEGTGASHAEEIARLRAEVAALRAERDAYRADVDRARTGRVSSTTTELQLLSTKLSKDIKEDFYGSVTRMTWIAAVLLGVATLGGYLRFDAIIDDKIDDRVAEKRAEIGRIEQEIQTSLDGFKKKATEALRELGERSAAVRVESESALTQIRTLKVTVTSSAGASVVKASAWDPWFGDVPGRFVGIAGSQASQVGYEATDAQGRVGGAFSQHLRAALTSAAADANGDGRVSWVEAVTSAGAALQPKYPQTPVIVGDLRETSALFSVRNAAPASRKGRLRVLLIGINDYGGQFDLRGPLDDVKQFEALLRSGKLAESSSFEIRMLTDAAATAKGINAAIAELAASAAEDDVLLVLYSGHVSSIDDKTSVSPTGKVKVLVPRDASLAANTPAQPGGQLLPVPDVARAFSATKARASVLIIDG